MSLLISSRRAYARRQRGLAEAGKFPNAKAAAHAEVLSIPDLCVPCGSASYVVVRQA
jgi:hypothetical protein